MLDLKYSSILKVALPLMVSSFIQAVVLITDTAFLSRYNTISFDAAGNAGLIYITLFMALVGMSDGSQILIARRIGQQKIEAIGRIFGTSVFTLLGLSIFFYFILNHIIPDGILEYSKHLDIAKEECDFLEIRSYALFFTFISLSIQAFFFATGKTWVVLVSSIITAFSNILLDYFLIFGESIFPEMGLKGAALASTLAEGIGAAFLLIYLLSSKMKKEYQLFSYFTFNLKSFKELIKIGNPIMLQGILALGTWTIFFFWIEQMGKFELTVSQNIRSIYFLAFIPIWGFSTTTKTYISQYLGSGDFEALKIIQRRIQLLTSMFLGVIILITIFFPYEFISMINPEEAYLEKSRSILFFISGSTFLFGIFSVYFQTINGSGHTIVTFTIELICVGIYLISAYILIKIIEVDIFWVWSVEYIYFISMGILSYGYLKLFDWKNKIV